MSAPFGGIAPTDPRRTGQPVRRDSYHRGEREHLIWKSLGKDQSEARRFKWALREAAKRLDHSTKEPGTRMGAIGLSGRAVLEALCEIVDHASGRLEPSIAAIAAKARLGIRTVARALVRLRQHGFVDWLRRTEPTDNDGAGPQVHQVSNAYWFALRGRAEGFVRLLLGRAPPDLPGKEMVKAAASIERKQRLDSMRARRPGIAAADVLSDEAKASLRRLKELRSATALKAENPGDRGQK